MHILTAFYHLLISFVLYTHSLIDALEYAQVGLSYTLNSFFCNIFLKNGYPENFINVSKDLWITYWYLKRLLQK